MDFSFAPALEELNRNGNAAFRIANEAKAPASYILQTILPERKRSEYTVEAGNMIIRSTMAGIVAMDSPYPMGGLVTVDSFREQTLKVAIQVGIPEAALRRLQEIMFRIRATGGSTIDTLVQEALNFYNKLALEPQYQMAEWLRGQALTRGALAFNFNGKSIAVDYGVPAANKFNTRTVASGEAYGAANSKWWDDVRAARRILKGGITQVLMNSVTAHEIIYNEANNVRIVAGGDAERFFTIQRLENTNGVVRPSEDRRDVITITLYDGEADLLNPETNSLKTVKYIEDGYVVFTGKNQIRGYEVGQGSTPRPDNDMELGYTHLAPTVEGNGTPGIWGDMRVPEEAPWRIEARTASNLLPVILNPEKLVIAHTEVAA